MNETLRDYNDFDQTVFRTTPEGYLTGKIRVTGAGVFSYMTADGIKRRLRPVKEVSSQDSIDSLNSKPVTLLHPMQDASPEEYDMIIFSAHYLKMYCKKQIFGHQTKIRKLQFIHSLENSMKNSPFTKRLVIVQYPSAASRIRKSI